MSFWKARPKESVYSKIHSSARMESPVQIGSWTVVEAGARIGRGTLLGHWSHVGEGCLVGEDVHFGPWAKIGRNVVLGNKVRLGSHTIVQDGVALPAGTVCQDFDLVTPRGIIAGRTGGYCMGLNGTGFEINGPFGQFRIPVPPGSVSTDQQVEDLHVMFEAMIDDYQWGRSDALEAFRIEERPEMEPDSGSAVMPSL